jgi:hypothetical protein
VALKFYNKETGKFYIRKPKLVHIGPINSVTEEPNLSDDEKYEISEIVNNVEYLGTEFGSKSIISMCKIDIFKIRDEVMKNSSLINNKKIEKINNETSSNIDLIKKQLGIYD